MNYFSDFDNPMISVKAHRIEGQKYTALNFIHGIMTEYKGE